MYTYRNCPGISDVLSTFLDDPASSSLAPVFLLQGDFEYIKVERTTTNKKVYIRKYIKERDIKRREDIIEESNKSFGTRMELIIKDAHIILISIIALRAAHRHHTSQLAI